MAISMCHASVHKLLNIDPCFQNLPIILNMTQHDEGTTVLFKMNLFAVFYFCVL